MPLARTGTLTRLAILVSHEEVSRSWVLVAARFARAAALTAPEAAPVN
jgi:hypothetical protein